jgi:hypothetical protein
MIRNVHPGSPEPGVKKAPDPGFGSATLDKDMIKPCTFVVHLFTDGVLGRVEGFSTFQVQRAKHGRFSLLTCTHNVKIFHKVLTWPTDRNQCGGSGCF